MDIAGRRRRHPPGRHRQHEQGDTLNPDRAGLRYPHVHAHGVRRRGRHGGQASCCASATCSGWSCPAIPAPSPPSEDCSPPTSGTTLRSLRCSPSAKSSGVKSGMPCVIFERSARERLQADGVDEAAMHFDDALDLRYVGQDYYLRGLRRYRRSRRRAHPVRFRSTARAHIRLRQPRNSRSRWSTHEVFAIGAFERASAAGDRYPSSFSRSARAEGASSGVLRTVRSWRRTSTM